MQHEQLPMNRASRCGARTRHHSKIVGGARPGTLAAQLVHPCPDHRKIVSGAGSGHVPSVFLCCWCDYPAAAIGSIRLGSLFLTLPTRVLTGQQIMPSEG